MASTPIRRRPVILTLALLFVVAVLYVPHPPPPISSFTTTTVSGASKESERDPQPALPADFNRKIWQLGSASQRDVWAPQTQTWTALNPEWHYEVLSDETSTVYVEDRFGGDAAVLDVWHDLEPGLRRELVRYLVMLADGGVYSGLDTSCLTPVEEWIPSSFANSTVGAVLGIGQDDTTADGRVGIVRWAMMAKPHHPIFEDILGAVIGGADHEHALRDLQRGGFTDAVMKTLSTRLGGKVEFGEMRDLKEPVLLGDVLLVPASRFGSGQRESDGEREGDSEALVRYYAGVAAIASDLGIGEDVQGQGDEQPNTNKGSEAEIELVRDDDRVFGAADAESRVVFPREESQIADSLQDTA
ncbi:unnamed protein product [Diplocarpon coronariae]|uniref:Alpha-1,6-mannosyltransferase Och n=1 Tax=Diplocarpon coronariae TaxID=2795749 RepID=A0A218Z058_9HELO|nr:alpha-1,6-mannosyltransferase Och [Marssonina coronariae]